MKVVLIALSSFMTVASATNDSGIKKVIELLSGMEDKVNSELSNEAKLMDDYSKYCDDTAMKTTFSIETAVKEIEWFAADSEAANAKIGESQSVISDAATDISEKEKELAGATKVRNDEHDEFVDAEKELMDTVDVLGRAASILKRSLSFVQSKSQLRDKMGNMLNALAAITDAAFLPSGSKTALSSFLEKLDDDSSDDLAFIQQPQGKTVAYESKSGGIVDTILSMQDKAEEQLSKLRKDEMVSKHEFEMLAQSLNDTVSNLKEQLAAAKKALSTAQSDKAEADESEVNTKKDKEADEAFLKKLQSGCQSKAQAWDARQVQAKEELAALAKAKEILSSGVKVMFAQVSTSLRRVRGTDNDEVDSRTKIVSLLRGLSRNLKSYALVQLTNHAKSDPFAKVKGLIEDMIAKLEKQAQEEATEKAYCDKEMAETNAKKEDLMSQIDGLTSKMDSKAARSAKLKSEVAELQKELADMAASQAEMDKLRHEEHEQYVTDKSDLESSIGAVQTALKVLSEYYGTSSLLQQPEEGPAFAGTGETGASAGGIIGMLEVAESDFTKNLAEAEATEDEAWANYESTTQENKVSKAAKTQDVKYKQKEANTLDKEVAELTSDEAGVQKELDAVLEYDAKIKDRCVAKPVSYEERAKRRAAEIEGLKEALVILDGESAGAFIQSKTFLAKVRGH